MLIMINVNLQDLLVLKLNISRLTIPWLIGQLHCCIHSYHIYAFRLYKDAGRCHFDSTIIFYTVKNCVM